MSKKNTQNNLEHNSSVSTVKIASTVEITRQVEWNRVDDDDDDGNDCEDGGTSYRTEPINLERHCSAGV